MFTTEQMKVIQFCADEVARQHDSPRAVGWLVGAWAFAVGLCESGHPLTRQVIEQLGRLVQPRKNPFGFRHGPVWVGNDEGAKHSEIREKVDDLCGVCAAGDLSPGEAYIYFQKIHPFFDGNGRCGKVIYFWLCGRLRDPDIKLVPNPWDISNP